MLRLSTSLIPGSITRTGDMRDFAGVRSPRSLQTMADTFHHQGRLFHHHSCLIQHYPQKQGKSKAPSILSLTLLTPKPEAVSQQGARLSSMLRSLRGLV
ncbi:hypothetical protein E2C01_031964 [Portunus trituberculatus]|uniref:Uncharacterized protein n=1 Tax=Portunus trituberculatus TaxID=210409 RepID=A0A5B7EZ25_PORTR|nr:hypothetical protein [Portunus trituberculatus]